MQSIRSRNKKNKGVKVKALFIKTQNADNEGKLECKKKLGIVFYIVHVTWGIIHNSANDN